MLRSAEKMLSLQQPTTSMEERKHFEGFSV